jgi:serine acetyltransferase
VLREDLLARYPEAGGWSIARKLWRFATDPSLQAVLTVRLVLLTPGRFLWVWRTWNIARFRMEIFRIEVGPGLHLPHPFSILIGPGTKIGRGATIHHNANIGFDRAPKPGQRLPCPTILDGVEVGTGSIIVGDITIGDGAKLRPGAYVSRDVPAGATVEADPIWTAGAAGAGLAGDGEG